MKVFISWSGPASRAAADALAEAIRDVFNGVEPWVSSADIKAGQEWFDELMKTLNSTKFAILCLTTRNKNAPWVLFEAGATTGRFGEMKLAPLLLDGEPSDLADPLARFQGVIFDKPGIESLFNSINDSVGKPMKPKVLAGAVAGIWGALESTVTAALAKDKPKFDVFLSAPMAAFAGDAEYGAFRSNVMKVVKTLRDDCQLTVYCALEPILSIQDFDTINVSARDDLEALEKSANFVMLYPQKLPTSAIFEAGYALARGLPSRLFVRSQSDLPFLMRKLPEAFSNVSILDDGEWTTYEDIAKRLVSSRKQWFGKQLHASLTR